MQPAEKKQNKERESKTKIATVPRKKTTPVQPHTDPWLLLAWAAHTQSEREGLRDSDFPAIVDLLVQNLISAQRLSWRIHVRLS